MPRYIDADALKNKLISFGAIYDFGLYLIDIEPAADVRPERHGKWVSWEEAGNYIPSPNRHECSVCHDCAQFLVNGIELLSSYCPNCGAKMDGKEHSNG